MLSLKLSNAYDLKENEHCHKHMWAESKFKIDIILFCTRLHMSKTLREIISPWKLYVGCFEMPANQYKGKKVLKFCIYWQTQQTSALHNNVNECISLIH